MAEHVQMIDSRERVALDLCKHIASYASDIDSATSLSKKEFFELYRQCHLATLGQKPEDFL